MIPSCTRLQGPFSTTCLQALNSTFLSFGFFSNMEAFINFIVFYGIPWWSSGFDSLLSLPRLWLIPGQGTKILQAAQHSQIKKYIHIVLYI